MSGVRAVWLTREQRDLLAMIAYDDLYVLSGPRFADMAAAWDAAPADPAGAVTQAVSGYANRADWDWTASAVLRVLGMPEDAS